MIDAVASGYGGAAQQRARSTGYSKGADRADLIAARRAKYAAKATAKAARAASHTRGALLDRRV